MKTKLLLIFLQLVTFASLAQQIQTQEIPASDIKYHGTIVFRDLADTSLQKKDLTPKAVINKTLPFFEKDTINSKENIIKLNPPLPNGPSPAPATSFLGMAFTGWYPPDVSGAVGTNHIVVAHNGGFRILDKAGTQISTRSLVNFWATTGHTDVFDPKILYDQYNNRWITTACATRRSSSSSMLIAATANGDPTGTWYLYSVDADNANTLWFDYPSFGFNKDWVCVTGNMFSMADAFQKSRMWIVKKSDLYAGATTPSVTVADNNTYFTICPAQTYDNTVGTLHLLAKTWSATDNLAWFTITGTTTPVVTLQATMPNSGNTIGWPTGAPQLGTATTITNGDIRMQNVVYAAGSLWCTYSVSLSNPTRSVVQWWEINPSNGSVIQFGRIQDPAGTYFYAYPNIGVNPNKDVVVALARFSSGQYASAAYATRKGTDALNTMNDAYQYKNGGNTYTSNRWGDYSTVNVDPSESNSFWVLQEYTSTTSNQWETQWAKVIPCPTLVQPSAFTTSSSSICQGATNVAYSVPTVANATGYSWSYSGTGATITGTTNSVTVSFSPTATSGTLSVSATNSCGNSAARTLAITVTATPNIPTTTASKLIICSGGSTTLSASGCAGTVTWSNGAGTGSSISVSPTSDISYTATCSVNSCLSGVSNSVSIKVIPQNLAVSSSTSPPFEAKDNITTTGNITISGTQTYKAGKSISLTSTPSTSISTAPGAVFTAKIEGCAY